MLREIDKVRQIPNDYFRRLFVCEDLDLCVWYKPDGTFHGFQLCYDLADLAKALTWREQSGFSHNTLDNGEENPLVNRTPVLKPGQNPNIAKIKALFRASDRHLPAEIRQFVGHKLETCEPKS